MSDQNWDAPPRTEFDDAPKDLPTSGTWHVDEDRDRGVCIYALLNVKMRGNIKLVATVPRRADAELIVRLVNESRGKPEAGSVKGSPQPLSSPRPASVPSGDAA